MRASQFLMQFGCTPLVRKEVKCSVMLWMVRSESFLGLLLEVGVWCCMYHPTLRGKVVVAGPMIAGGGRGGRSSSSASLPYCGGGSVGESSHTATGVKIVFLAGGSIVLPVRWGRCERSSHSSWYTRPRSVFSICAY